MSDRTSYGAQFEAALAERLKSAQGASSDGRRKKHKIEKVRVRNGLETNKVVPALAVNQTSL